MRVLDFADGFTSEETPANTPISYDNTQSGLTATTVQDAIDEIVVDLEAVTSDVSDLTDDVTALTGRVDQAEIDILAAETAIAALELALPNGDDYLQLEEQASTPTTPVAGKQLVYPKTDGKLYKLTSSGVETEVGSGAGSGEGSKNFIENGRFEADTSGWTESDDSKLTITRNTSDPLEGDADGLITKLAVDASGAVVSTVTLPIGRAYRKRGRQFLRFFYDATDVNYESGDLRVKAYNDATDSPLTVQPVANVDTNCGLLSTDTQGLISVLHDDTVENIRLEFEVTTDSATAATWGIHLASVLLGPDSPTPTAIDVDLGTEVWPDSQANATTSVKLYRKGKWLTAKGTTTFTGAASGATTVTIPSAYTADTNVYPLAAFDFVGDVYHYDSGGLSAQGPLALSSLTQLTLLANNVASTYDGIVNTSATVPFTWASGDKIEWEGRWVVSGWTSGNLMSGFEASLQTAKFTAKKSGNQTISSSSPTKIEWETIGPDNFNAWNAANHRYYFPRSGRFLVNASLRLQSATDENNIISIYINGSERVWGSDKEEFVISVNSPVDVEAGDYLEVFIDSTSDTSFTVNETDATYLHITAMPDFTTFGAYIDDRVLGTKILSANSVAPSSATLSDLTFSNLVVGRWYEVKGQFGLIYASNSIAVNHTHNGSTIASSVANMTSTSGDLRDGFNYVFQASATTLTFVATGAGTVFGNGTRASSYVQVIERSNLR